MIFGSRLVFRCRHLCCVRYVWLPLVADLINRVQADLQMEFDFICVQQLI